MKKIIAKIACATVLSMGIITNTAICADKEVKAEITQGYPNIATEGKTLEKQIASVIKAVKNLEKKAKAFNKIANKELTKGTGNNELLDTYITKNHFTSIQKYFENTKKAVASIRGFKSKSKIGEAINKASEGVNMTCLTDANKIFTNLKTISISEKTRKAALNFHSALNAFLKSLPTITKIEPTKSIASSDPGQLIVVNKFLSEFYETINEMKQCSVQEFLGQSRTEAASQNLTGAVSKGTTTANRKSTTANSKGTTSRATVRRASSTRR